MKRRSHIFRTTVAALALVTLGATMAAAAAPNELSARRNFDARIALTRDALVAPGAGQRAALDGLRSSLPALMVTFDDRTGATRTLWNRGGYLTGPNRALDPLSVAIAYVRDNAGVLGLSPNDLGDYELRSSVFNQATGATHVYLRQRAHGLALYNGQLQVNVNRDGRVVSVNNSFLPNLAVSVNATTPSLSIDEAVRRAADSIGVAGTRAAGGELMLLPIRGGEARLVWNFQLPTGDGQHYFDFTVDALTGEVWTRFDWVANADYRVIPLPFESPNHAPVTPPADGRTIETNPQDATASPFGWHDTNGAPGAEFTTTEGNNVHAYTDTNADNIPDAGSDPDGGAGLVFDFDFPIDFGTQQPSTYPDAAVTNLFYWNNIIHDVQYQYGFNEDLNFQVTQYGVGPGVGGDSVNAEGQDGSGTCNANMLTLPDGSSPRMQMFICENNGVAPAADGDFDNGVIVHEYGHGISNRTVGGALNVSCLNNTQQPGEGWSDWWGLAYTGEVGDAGTDARGIGTYLFEQPANGPGIRPAPYSTDFAVNNFTYSDIGGVSVPHGVGFVFATAAWEAYWELVGIHGFDPDFYAGTGGNNRMMLYIQEGMSNTICSPTHLDVRDGIIQAATDNFGGVDVCPLWDAFARRGYGTDATTAGPNSTVATDGFDTPLECQCQPAPIADAGPDQTICVGDSTTVGTPAQPDNTYSWAPGGETTAEITVSPAVTTTYTVTATTVECGSDTDSATVYVTDGSDIGLLEDFEGGAPGWATSGLWHLADSSLCGDPAPTTPPTTMYYGQDATCNYDTGVANSGTLTSPVILGVDATSNLNFNYWRQVESFAGAFDITQVDVVNVGDGSKTTVFYLDSSTPSTSLWTPGGPISLAAFDGQAIQLEFTFATGDSVGNNFTGWFVDDVEVTSSFTCQAPPFTLFPPDPGVAGAANDFDVTGATPGGLVYYAWGRNAGPTTVNVPSCGPITLDLGPNVKKLGAAFADGSGNATLTKNIKPFFSGKTPHYQAVDRASCTKSNPVVFTYP